MTARLVVMTGPDRGKSFDLLEELTHVGRGADNQVVLSDPDLAEHQVSLVDRSGRFALFTPLLDSVSVEGTSVPADKWVWLPERAEIRLTRRTQIKFEQQATGGAVPRVASEVRPRPVAPTTPPRSDSPEEPADAPVTMGTESLSTIPRPKKGEGKGRRVAKFITDGPGETLVRLGDDGHLPELALQDATTRRKKSDDDEGDSSGGNPLILFAALGVSVLMSVAMLFLEAGGLDRSAGRIAAAREEITRFYGEEGKPLKAYQVNLRQARQAWSRRDRVRERSEYLKVLSMLRAEGNERSFSGVTGNRDEDRALEELIGTLLQ
jgi:hypothetical protein